MHIHSPLLYLLSLACLAKCAAFYPFHSAVSPNLTATHPSILLPRYGMASLNTTKPKPRKGRIRLGPKRLFWIPTTTKRRKTRSKVGRTSFIFERSPSPSGGPDARPTPEPTGEPSPSKTVHITDEKDFSLIAPNQSGEYISSAEADGVAYCVPGSRSSGSTSCSNTFPPGFITAAAFKRADDNTFVQVTGCMDPSKFDKVDPSDEGGQFDIRFPNGAQCDFGGYGASFIEQIEPAAKRFCMRCCSTPNDQVNCNSHRDQEGCLAAIPGVYDFPDLGISCS